MILRRLSSSWLSSVGLSSMGLSSVGLSSVGLSSLCIAALLTSAGCGGSDVPVGDGGSELDGGTGPRDSGPPGDGGSEPDAQSPDAAVDGGPPDSGAPEPCDTPGAIETVACGMCGTVERFCGAGGTWAYGVCEGEGGCAPGTTQMVECGSCGEQLQRCTAACAWEDVGACTGEGVCVPGTMSRSGEGCPAGQNRDVLCSASCVFEPTSACSADACPTPGVIESVPCGLCGSRDRFCNVSHVWEYGACTGEGVCMPGTTGSAACGMCGTQTTRCNDTCTWVPFGTCGGEGTCTPGTTQRTSAGCPAGSTRLLQCDAACGYTVELEACRATFPVDVLFLVDATPSNWFDFQAEATTFVSRCVDPALAIADVAVGIAYYGDLSAPPETFVGGVEIGGTSAAISANVGSQTDIGGADDSTMEALHIVSGGSPQAGAIPFTCSAGRVAGGCWRPGARRVVVLHTDEAARGGPDAASAGVWNPWPTGPSWTTVLPRLMTDGTSVFTIVDDDYVSTGNPVAQYAEMATDLGQPATDVYLEGPTEPGIGVPCDAIVARVRALAGM